MATTDINPERQRLLKYLSSFGLNGAHMRAGHDEFGYNRIDFPDEEYYKLPWPPGFNYRWLCSLEDVARLEDLRLAGVGNVTRMVR